MDRKANQPLCFRYVDKPRREKTGFNKYADQLRCNREADLPICFRNTESAIPLLSKSEISSL